MNKRIKNNANEFSFFLFEKNIFIKKKKKQRNLNLFLLSFIHTTSPNEYPNGTHDGITHTPFLKILSLVSFFDLSTQINIGAHVRNKRVPPSQQKTQPMSRAPKT